MNKIEKYCGRITGYGYDGEGVCRVNGKVCFVPFSLRDEDIEFQITKDTSSFARGELLKVLSKSDKRVTAPCPYYQKCGGCTYQHTTHQNELDIKKELLENQLKKVNFHENVEVVPSSKEYGYRNKVKLFVYGQKIGLKQRQSNFVCDIDGCMIVDENISQAIKIIKTFFTAQNLFQFYDQIVIRSEKDMCLINFIMRVQKNVNYQGLYLMLGAKFGIYQTFKGQTQHMIGRKFIELDQFGLHCEFSVNSFHQVNDEIEEKLYNDVLSSLKGKNIINCYSGGGVLSGMIALKKYFVTAIELGKSEHEDAEKLKDQNNLIYLRNVQGDCGQVLPQFCENVETIIVDPPRVGVEQKVIDAINASGADRVIYISCNSATFVRDAQRLEKYKLKKTKLYDMFPRTGEYEILAVFDKK